MVRYGSGVLGERQIGLWGMGQGREGVVGWGGGVGGVGTSRPRERRGRVPGGVERGVQYNDTSRGSGQYDGAVRKGAWCLI